MRTVLMHPLFCPFWLITISLSLLTQTQYTLLFPLSLSHQCLIHLIYSYSLSISIRLANIHTEHSASLCCGSCSFISLSELSGDCCPGMASVRDVVINGSVEHLHIFPWWPTHWVFPCLSQTHCLCSCASVRSIMVHAVASYVRKWENKEGDFDRVGSLLEFLSLVHCISLLVFIRIRLQHHIWFLISPFYLFKHVFSISPTTFFPLLLPLALI